MSEKKKAVRTAFKKAVLDRDGHRCRMCGVVPENGDEGLDAHHIIDRHDLPGGGYVAENGISLCQVMCHPFAEQYHLTGEGRPGYSPDELFAKIGSSRERALRASRRLVT